MRLKEDGEGRRRPEKDGEIWKIGRDLRRTAETGKDGESHRKSEGTVYIGLHKKPPTFEIDSGYSVSPCY